VGGYTRSLKLKPGFIAYYDLRSGNTINLLLRK